MDDFLIVGGGLAGINFAYQCLLNKKSFVLIDNEHFSSSKVAAGVYNPIILKRYTLSWKANLQLDIFDDVYGGISSFTDSIFDYKIPLRRRLFNVEEQNDWFFASAQNHLNEYLKTPLLYIDYHGVNSDFGFGEINKTGYINTQDLIKKFINQLKIEGLFRSEVFDFNKLNIQDEFILYHHLKYKHIVFAEGFNVKHNPFFSQLPILGSKGETLTISVKNLNLDFILKGNVFVLPLGNHLFKVGSTYTWDDLTDAPTEKGLNYLIHEVKKLINLPFEVVNHEAGIRPSSRDRRPMIGTHPKFKNLHIINGLGSRGVMIAPLMAMELYNHICHGKPLDQEADIKRFKKLTW